MKLKICGITSESDAKMCDSLGVDYLGFNFYRLSKRYIAPENAVTIIRNLKNAISVGIFVEPEVNYIKEIVKSCNLAAVQIHSRQSSEFCKRLRDILPGIVLIQAFNINQALPENLLSFECDYFLFDRYDPEMPGGTGKNFNWELLPFLKKVAHRSFIAGGITPDNVDRLFSLITPYGIDVATGVEKAPGIKDIDKVKIMVEKVKRKRDEKNS